MTAIINEALLRAMVTARGLGARLREERGQDLIEYAMLGGLIAAAIAAAIGLLLFTDPLTAMADGIGRCIDFDSTTDCG